MFKGKRLTDFDYPLFFITLILVFFGTIMIFSSSVVLADIRWKSPYLFVSKQVIWVVLGIAGAFIASNFNYHHLQKLVKPLMLLTFILLCAVLIVGPVTGGAKRWIKMGFLSFQPSELAKLTVIIALADYLDRKKSRLREWRGLWPALFVIGLFSFMIAVEPDLGTPVLLVITGMCMLFTAGANLWKMIVMGVSCLPFVMFEIMRKPYRVERLKTYFQSWIDVNSGSYQITQSILALGSGGFFGKGLAKSQLKLLYLPEPHTDFIFPIIGEELGFFGAILLIFLFIVFSWRGIKIARNSRDFFGALLAIGITYIIIFQVLINMGVACGLLPTKGLPLPFVSFGGSALVVNMIEVGILLNISKRVKK